MLQIRPALGDNDFNFVFSVYSVSILRVLIMIPPERGDSVKRRSCRRRASGISAVARALLPGIALLVLSALDSAAQSQGRLQYEEILSSRLMVRRDVISYRNYAINNFANYPNHTVPIVPALADNYHPREFTGPLGDKLITGFEFLSWQELRRPGLSCEDQWGAVCGSNFMQRDGGVIVANDGYGNWAYRALAGATGPLHLSPLTVSLAQTEGLRIDLLTPRAQFTGFARRWTHSEGNSTLLLANRVQTELGGLKVALNWANNHRYWSTRQGNSLKGQVGTEEDLVDWIFVRVRDDSPDDGKVGPVVQDVRLVINGETRPDLVPYVIRHPNAVATQVGRILVETGSFRPTPYLKPRFDWPMHADYLYRIAHERGEDVSNRTNLPGLLESFRLVSDAQALQLDREEQVVYIFDLTAESNVISVAVEALAANDYEFSWATVGTINERNPNYVQRYNAGAYRHVRRAWGDVQDGSNLKQVRFQVGQFTGGFYYSAETTLEVLGLEMHAEYARSSEYSRYYAKVGGEKSFDSGPRFSTTGDAYFVNLLRWFGWGRLGAELFKIHPDFESLVEDNDDGDSRPDGSDIDGVYLGLDEDRDGYPDTNRNGDEVPDYVEPFLMYDVEPSEFSYGLDRNNNDEPDFREDDSESDYPYDWDQLGYHLFAQLDLSSHWSLAAGRYQATEMLGFGRSKTSYSLLTYQREDAGRWRKLFFENNLRRVKDDIPDQYNVIEEERRFSSIYRAYSMHTATTYGSRGFQPKSRKDPLAYRDSYVNESYLESRLQPLSGLNLVQKLRLRLNWQQSALLPGGFRARARRLDYWTVVHAVDYIWRRGRLTLQPKFKFRALRSTDQSSDQLIRSEYDTLPILQAGFQLMPKTIFRLGLQGWGPLPYRFDDRARKLESFERRTAISSVTMASTYLGYDLVTILGLEKDRLTYHSRARRSENFNTVSFFVRVLVGFTEYGRLI